MTKTRKRFLALIIIFTMLFSYFIPISSVNAEGDPDGTEITTIEDVLATVEGGFPTRDGTNNIPDHAWLNENGAKLYLFNYISDKIALDGSSISSGGFMIEKNAKLTPSKGNYTYNYNQECTITFNMDENNRLISVNCSDYFIEGKPNSSNINGTYVPQTHNFTYEAENNIITATCSKTGCPLTDNKLSLTLTAPESLMYTGSPVEIGFGSGEADAWTGASLSLPTIEYTAKDGSELTDHKAVDVGSYTAIITVDTDKTATLDFEIVKATPYIKNLPEPRDINAGEKLSDSTLYGGYVQVSSIDSTQIGGLFEWTSGDIVPNGSDSEITPYSVTFTPADDKNYNTVTCEVTLKINSTETKTIADVLNSVDGCFPSTFESGWVSDEGNIIYRDNGCLRVANNDINQYNFNENHIITSCENGYFCKIENDMGLPPDIFVDCIFVMEDNKLVEIKINEANYELIPFKGTYTPRFETVTFDMKGHGTEIQSQTIRRGTNATKPTEPTANGFVFEGWYADATLTTEFDFNAPITKDITLYAKWTKNVVAYSVTFKDGENVLFTRSNITSGEKVTRPEVDPAKEGYEFKGWYADATLTTEFDFNAPITKDTFVYAKYEKTQVNPPMPPADELKDIELDVKFNDFSGFVRINDKMNDGVFEADSYKGTYIKVGYTTSDKTNKIYIIPSFGESRVKDVTINGIKYSREDEGVEVSPENGLIVTIAGAEKYTIIANPDEDAPTTRTIIWANSDFNEDAKPDDYNEDAVLKNGKARVIAIYDEDGNKISGEQEVDENGLGFITASKNQKVVFEFTPNYGYQLTKILANGFELEPQDTLNQYVFTMPDTNVHFTATFTKVGDIVKADSKKVSSGAIVLANNELDAGTARLSVKDIELSDDKVKEFNNAAGEYEIKSYLDIDLDQIFYKGSNDESNVWENKIDTLSNKATITLKLADGITADDIVIVHNIHDGDNYEIIEIENYDPETNTITFKTNSFSNYAIATKTSSNTNNDTPTNTNDNPKTGDNIYVYISLMAFAMVGIIITSKSLKKSK